MCVVIHFVHQNHNMPLINKTSKLKTFDEPRLSDLCVSCNPPRAGRPYWLRPRDLQPLYDPFSKADFAISALHFF